MAQYPATDSMGRDYDDPAYGNYGLEPGRGGGTSSSNQGRGKWKDNIMKALDLASDWKGQSKSSPGGNKNNDDDEYKQPGMAGGGFSDLGGGNTVQQGFVNQPFTLTTPGKRSMWGRIAGTTVGFIAGGPAGAYKGYQVGNQFDA